MKTNIIGRAVLHAIATAVYVGLVALLMSNAEQLFGKQENFWGPLAFLLLFVLSATITGSLVLGRPFLLYLDGKKEEAVKFFLLTVGFLLAITIVIFVALVVI